MYLLGCKFSTQAVKQLLQTSLRGEMTIWDSQKIRIFASVKTWWAKSNQSFSQSVIQSIFDPGEVSEWSKEHAWKVCMRQKCILGSNPSLSAIKKPLRSGFIIFEENRKLVFRFFEKIIKEARSAWFFNCRSPLKGSWAKRVIPPTPPLTPPQIREGKIF